MCRALMLGHYPILSTRVVIAERQIVGMTVQYTLPPNIIISQHMYNENDM